jgi:hypothetical protein
MPLSAQERSARASHAARKRWGSDPTPETEQFEESRLEEHIRELVARAPKMTAEQAARLRQLFRYGPAEIEAGE